MVPVFRTLRIQPRRADVWLELHAVKGTGLRIVLVTLGSWPPSLHAALAKTATCLVRCCCDAWNQISKLFVSISERRAPPYVRLCQDAGQLVHVVHVLGGRHNLLRFLCGCSTPTLDADPPAPIPFPFLHVCSG